MTQNHLLPYLLLLSLCLYVPSSLPSKKNPRRILPNPIFALQSNLWNVSPNSIHGYATGIDHRQRAYSSQKKKSASVSFHATWQFPYTRIQRVAVVHRRSSATHRGKEQMGKHSARYRAMCSWAGRLFSSLIVTSHRNEIKGSITFNWTTIFSFRSHRIAWPRSPHSWPWSAIPISVYFAYRLRIRSRDRANAKFRDVNWT